MHLLREEGDRLILAFPKAGNGCLGTGLLIVFLAIGVGFALAFIGALTGWGPFGQMQEMVAGADDFPLAPFIGVFAVAFTLVPLFALVTNSKKLAERLNPDRFIFNASNRRMEIWEDADSENAEAWVPYGTIAGFMLDSFTTTSGSGSSRSTTRWYVLVMLKKDGAAWDLLKSTQRSQVEQALEQVRQNVQLSPDELNSAGVDDSMAEIVWPVTAPMYRRSTSKGLVVSWHVPSALVGVSLFVLISAGFSWLCYSLFTSPEPGDGIWVFLIVCILFDLGSIWAFASGILNLNRDKAIGLASAGLELGFVSPRKSDNFTIKNTVPYNEIASVAYSWTLRNNNQQELTILGNNALSLLQAHHSRELGAASLGSLGDFWQIWKDSKTISVAGLRLSDILLLEAALEYELRKRSAMVL